MPAPDPRTFAVAPAERRSADPALPDFATAPPTDAEPDTERPGHLILDSRPRDAPSTPQEPAPPSAAQSRQLALVQALQRSPSPSQLLNRWQAALADITTHQASLARLFRDCPTLHSVMAQALPAGSNTDPKPALPPDGSRHNVKALEKSSHTIDQYWAGLAPQSCLSRQEQAGELRKRLIADKALLHHAAGRLSEQALAMLQELVDWPTRAARRQCGGDPARLSVCRLGWVGQHAAWLTFAGVLVLERVGAVETTLVAFFPGIGQELYAFESAAQLQSQLARWLAGERKNLLWHLLPLNLRHALFDARQARIALRLERIEVSEDAFAYSAKSSISNQASNEIIAATLSNQALLLARETRGEDDAQSQPLDLAQACSIWRAHSAGQAVERSLARAIARLARLDSAAQREDISFARLSAHLPGQLCRAKVRRQEAALQALLDSREPQALDEYRVVYEQWQALCRASAQVLVGFDERIDDLRFWSERSNAAPGRRQQLASLRQQALLKDIELLRREHRLSDREARRLSDCLQAAGRPRARPPELCVAGLAVGPSLRVLGGFAITSPEALANPQLRRAAYLYLPGEAGGLAVFDSLATLTRQLANTFKTRPDSPLWHYLDATQRGAARAQVAQLAAAEPWSITLLRRDSGAVMQASVNEQIDQGHAVALAAAARGEPIFAEVDDLPTTQALLAQELEGNLRAPPHQAREQALANILQVRMARALLDHLPAWLSQAAGHVRREYLERLTRYQQSIRALDQSIERELPSLERFARQQLQARLKRDGLENLEPQRPIVEFPDGIIVTQRSARPIPPAHDIPVLPPPPLISYSPSPAVTRYSLEQLALLNIDPSDETLQARLAYLKVLDERLKPRLTPSYLSQTLFELDIAGNYAKAINLAFYATEDPTRTAPDGTRLALLTRPYRLKAELDGWAALQQGVEARDVAMFRAFLGARSREDLRGVEFDLVLHAVVLGIGVQDVGLDPLSAILLVQDTRSGRTLRYLFDPGHSALAALTVFTDLEAARQALRRLLDEPGMAGFLAASVMRAGDSAETLQAHIERAARQAPQPWIWSQPLRHPVYFQDFFLNLAGERIRRIRQEVSRRATSKEQLLRQRQQRKAARTWSHVLLGLSFVPLLGVPVGLYEVFQGARKVRVEGSALAVAELAAACASLLFEMAGSAIPARPGARLRNLTPASVRRLSAQGRGQGFAVKGALDQLSGARSPRKYVTAPFKGYESDESLAGLTPLLGTAQNGYFRKANDEFITRGAHVYAVYRRRGEEALRLRKAGKSFEPAVFLSASGQWTYHPAYGLRGGMHSAEQQLCRAFGWSQERARMALDRYRFPVTQRAPLETELAGYMLRNELIPPHLARYAMAGPATTAITTASELIDRLPSLDALDWLHRGHWERDFLPAQVQPPTPVGHAQVYPIASTPTRHALKIKGSPRYVELLPDGSAPHAQLFFIKGPEPLADAITDLHKWTTTRAIEQPLPVRFCAATRSVRIHEPLLREPVQKSVQRLFGSLSPASVAILSQALIQRADTSSGQATATRLVNIARTLAGWDTQGPRTMTFAEASDPLQLLATIAPSSDQRLPIRRMSLADSRPRGLDAELALDERAALLAMASSGIDTRKVELVVQATRRVLGNLGYSVGELHQVGKTRGRHFLIATYRDHPARYWISPRYVAAGELRLHVDPGQPQYFSASWFDRQIREIRDKALSRQLQTAQDAQALGGIVALISRQIERPAGHPDAWALLIRRVRPQ